MYPEKNNVLRPYFLYFAVIGANILSFGVGVAMNWSSPIIPFLNSTDTSVNPLPKPTSTLESTWIVSITGLSAMIGACAAGPLTTILGKKRAILIFGLPIIVAHLIAAFSTRVWMFILSRFIMGLSIGYCFPVMASYIGDIAENNNRGLLGSISSVFISIGALFVFCVGPFISIQLFSLLNLIPFILQWAFFGMFVPETPYSLIQRKSFDEAKRSLAFYRGKNISEIENEFRELMETINVSKKTDQKGTSKLETLRSIFQSKPLSKGLKIIVTLLFLQSLSGMAAVAAYYQTIFDESGGSIGATYSVMIIGVDTLFATILTSILVERLGRKLLLLLNFIILSASLFSLATYFYLKAHNYDISTIGWVPISSLILYVVGYNLGAGIPWVFSTDMFNPNVIDILSTFSSPAMFFTGFIISLVYPYMKNAMGNYGAFYLFASAMFCSIPYTLYFVPETKGKSVEKVQEILNK